LSSQYYHLFQLCEDPFIPIFDVVISGGQTLKFSRVLVGILLTELNEVCSMIRSISLSLERDHLKWRRSPSGTFSSHEVYQWLILGLYMISELIYGGYYLCHLKLGFFIWLVSHNKILTRDLIKRG
jgi:hypothetical protein